MMDLNDDHLVAEIEAAFADIECAFENAYQNGDCSELQESLTGAIAVLREAAETIKSRVFAMNKLQEFRDMPLNAPK